jgi:hypothetical protein
MQLRRLKPVSLAVAQEWQQLQQDLVEPSFGLNESTG